MSPDPNLFPEPEVDLNRVVMQPFSFMMDGDEITAFLKTLSDGCRKVWANIWYMFVPRRIEIKNAIIKVFSIILLLSGICFAVDKTVLNEEKDMAGYSEVCTNNTDRIKRPLPTGK